MCYRIPGFKVCALAALLAGCGAMHRATPGSPVTARPDYVPHDARSAMVYQILLGEVAGQRGQLAASVQSYLAAARASNDPRIAERATQIALFARDEKSAQQAAERWLTLQPANPEARQTLAMLYLRAGRVDDSIAQFEQLIALAKKDSTGQALVQIAVLLSREQDKGTALKIMQGLTARHDTEPYAHLSLSQLAAMSQDLALAEQSVRRALQLKPDWSEALSLQARIQAERGDIDGALAGMRRALELHPQDTSLRLSYARLLVQAKRLKEARAQFQRLAREAPNDPDALYALGLLALDAGQSGESARHFKRLLALGKREDEARFYLGRIAEDQRLYAEALNWYSQIEQGEHQLEAELRIAALLAKRGELDAARDRLHAIAEQNPALVPRITLAEGELLVNAHQLAEAMRLYDKALTAAPDNNDLLYARALLAEKMGHVDILERDLRIILKRDPDNAMALNALGYTLADRTTRLDEALVLITHALALLPNDAAVLDSMGWVQFRLGHHAEALKYLRQAYELNDDAEIAAHLGEVLWAGGDRAGARKLWQKALKTDPDNPALRAVLQRFPP